MVIIVQELCESRGGRPGLAVLMSLRASVDVKHHVYLLRLVVVQELFESRGGRPGLAVLTSLLVSVDVKLY